LIYRNDLVTTGLVGGTCGTRTVSVVSYPVDGIQNGSPDGIALMAPDGSITEFISYEGATVGTAGATAGLTGRDIRVSQSGAAVGLSLQMDSAGTWYSPGPNTFGVCNDATVAAVNVITSVSITPSAPAATAGNTVTLTATASASGSPRPGAYLTWTSSNTGVATVNVNGVVSALSAGTTQITATAASGAFATVTLTVSDPPGVPPVRFSELHYDNVGADINEAIEIEGPAGTDLTGWSVVLYNGTGGAAYDTRTLSGAIPSMCSGRGVVYLIYAPDGIQNGAPDGFALVDGSGTVVEFLSYEGSFTAIDGPASGMTSSNIGVSQTGSPIGQSLSRNGIGIWQAPAAATIGACNSGEGPLPPVLPNAITITGRTPFDVALPVGFEDQLFATLLSAQTGLAIPTTFTWTTETPAIATIDQDGVIHALGAGSAILRATATDGTTRTYTLPIVVATPSATAAYQSHVEFGVPTDSNPADDFRISRPQYESSFSAARGIPNWVSYNLEASHFGTEDRCDCFTYDPELPAASRYTTADYTGAGAFHGYGIDRGHLMRSFDRTAGSLDNARTFYFSNIFPQAADFNQGTWADMENDLGNLATLGNKELFIITGVSGSLGTVKDEGLITIPEWAWKVAVVLDKDEGLASIDSYDDLELIAVVMHNDSLIAGAWQNYQVSVDSVEKLSGYDLLSALPDYIEVLVESEAGEAVELIQELVANGTIKPGNGNSLSVKLDAAIAALGRGDNAAATGQLNALLKEIDAMVKSGRLPLLDANALRAALEGIIAAASA
jgi:DNA/RNA endonuclease G (NUC1)